MNKKALLIMPFRKPYDGYFKEIYEVALEAFQAAEADNFCAAPNH